MTVERHIPPDALVKPDFVGRKMPLQSILDGVQFTSDVLPNRQPAYPQCTTLLSCESGKTP